jgi:hypothetical protein
VNRGFSAAYDQAAERARALGWAYREFEAGHFHLVVGPEAVAGTLSDLIEEWFGERAG